MLRITKGDDASLRLEGRLEGAWVEVLRKTWEESAGRPEGRKVTVDLGAVSFADQEGRALLLEIQKEGAVLARVSGFMRHILADSGDDSDRKGE